MPKTVRQQRPAERPEAKYHILRGPEIVSLDALRRVRKEARKGSLIVKVRIPSQVVPLFKALVELAEADSPETFAAWALCKGLVCEEAMDKFDKVVNDLL